MSFPSLSLPLSAVFPVQQLQDVDDLACFEASKGNVSAIPYLLRAYKAARRHTDKSKEG